MLISGFMNRFWSLWRTLKWVSIFPSFKCFYHLLSQTVKACYFKSYYSTASLSSSLQKLTFASIYSGLLAPSHMTLLAFSSACGEDETGSTWSAVVLAALLQPSDRGSLVYIVVSLSVSDPRVELWQVLPLLLVEEVEEGEGEGLTDTSTYVRKTHKGKTTVKWHAHQSTLNTQVHRSATSTVQWFTYHLSMYVCGNAARHPCFVML